MTLTREIPEFRSYLIVFVQGIAKVCVLARAGITFRSDERAFGLVFARRRDFRAAIGVLDAVFIFRNINAIIEDIRNSVAVFVANFHIMRAGITGLVWVYFPISTEVVECTDRRAGSVFPILFSVVAFFSKVAFNFPVSARGDAPLHIFRTVLAGFSFIDFSVSAKRFRRLNQFTDRRTRSVFSVLFSIIAFFSEVLFDFPVSAG